MKADELAEAFPGIAVNAVSEIRTHLVQAKEAHHQPKHTDATDSPANENTAGMGAGSGHIAGGSKDSAADGRTDDHGGELGET